MSEIEINYKPKIFDNPEFCGDCGYQQYAPRDAQDLGCTLFLSAGRMPTFLKEVGSNKSAVKLPKCKKHYQEAKIKCQQ